MAVTGPWSEEDIDAYYRILGRNVRAIRLEHGITQQHVADRCGLTRSSIANLECGRQRTPVHTMWMIAQAMGVTLADIAPDTGTVISVDTVVSRAIREQAEEIRRLRGKLARIRMALGGKP